MTDIARLIYDPVVRELPESRLKPLLKNTQLQGVLYDQTTVWPIGFEIPASAIYKEGEAR